MNGLARTHKSRAIWLRESPRRGMILFVVVAMLALLAVVSFAFYYYASQEALTSRLALDNQQRTRPDPDALLAYALRQLVFDERPTGPFTSQMAMYSLLRNLFGSEGLEPFSGTGRFHGPDFSYYPNPPGTSYDRYYAICYWNRQHQPDMDGTLNPPYTFPDFNHCFLGRITTDGPTGELVIVEQSFIRRSFPVGPGAASYFDPYDPVYINFWIDPNWPGATPMPLALREALVFRPHPWRHPNFPPPADIGGDVRNLPPGIPVKIMRRDPTTGQLVELRHYGNDSIWMDLNFPVQTGPDGRTYKPLFAFFITELDSRIDAKVFADTFRYRKDSGGINRGLPNRVSSFLGLGDLEALYRHGDTGADGFISGFFDQQNPPDFTNRVKEPKFRHSLTMKSADLMWAGLGPLGFDPITASAPPNGPDYHPSKGRLHPLPYSPWYGEPWRLNRRLNLADPNLTSGDRQKLARDIYFRLLVATGKLWDIYDPNNNTQPRKGLPADPDDPTLPRPDFRDLAQLALNMVDFLDPDDNSTPFFFACDVNGNPLPATNPDDLITLNPNYPDETFRVPKYWVFGTELPRPVINEVLAEYQAPANNNPGVVTIRVWVELWNPPASQQCLNPPSNVQDVSIRLGKGNNNSKSAYRVVLAAAHPATDSPANVTGVPAEPRNWDWANNKLLWDDDAFDNMDAFTGEPHSTLESGRYLIIGPTGDTIDNTLGKSPRVQTAAMEYKLYQDNNGDWYVYDSANNTPTNVRAYDKGADPNNPNETSGILVLLQRLADPSEPHNPVRNPYITVDWVHLPGAGLNDRSSGGNSRSYIRVKANRAQLQLGGMEPQQTNQNTMMPANTWHSLGNPNQGSQASAARDKFVHLNTNPSSPLDLLFVSKLKPHQLTSTFDSYQNGFSSPHLAPWFNTRYHRFFELVDMPGKGGVSSGGHRIFGRLNLAAALLNSNPYDLDNFKAVVDLWLSANFGKTEVEVAWNVLRGASPIYSMGIDGVNRSWFAPDEDGRWCLALRDGPTYDIPDPPSLFDYSEDGITTGSGQDRPHPYQQAELARRLWPNITTRSNVFAVWCTVGFFECRPNNPNPNPADPRAWLIGPEIDADVGRQVRYRFFAIVDRTIIAEWMLANTVPVEAQLGRDDIDPRRTGPNGEPPCVIYWSRIQ